MPEEKKETAASLCDKAFGLENTEMFSVVFKTLSLHLMLGLDDMTKQPRFITIFQDISKIYDMCNDIKVS